MIFTQNGNDLQNHKEIIYAFVSKDKRFFSEYQKELTRNLPLYPSLELLLVDFAVIQDKAILTQRDAFKLMA